MNEKTTVGVIGLGLGKAHLAGYLKDDRVEVVGLADLDVGLAERTASEHGVPHAFSAYRDLLALGPDLVSVCLPNFLHAPVTIDGLDAGVHVLCEKPMALNATQARDMAAAARRNGRYLMIALNNRFRAETQILKKLVEQDVLGEIYYAKTGWLRRSGIPGAGTWFTRKAQAGGGPLIDLGVHMIDLARWLMGNPRPVSVVGATYARLSDSVEGAFDVEDLAAAFIRFEDDATLVAETSWASHVPSEGSYVKFMGTRGGAEITGNELTVYTDLHGEQVDITPAYAPREWSDCIAAEIAHFVDCIRAGRTPMSTGEQGVEIMQILDGIYESAAGNRMVRID